MNEDDKLALTKGNRFPEAQAKTYRDIEGDLWKDDGAGYLLLVTDDGPSLNLKRTRVEEYWGPLELS